MIRRSHKKSRRGCVECKRGHKKCDESRPTCFNCTSSQKQCSFTRSARSQSPNSTNFIPYTGHDDLARSQHRHLSIASRTSSSSSHSPIPRPLFAENYINILHLELFQNVTSDAISFFSAGPSKDQWVATVLRYSFSFPYLMYEALAFSAFHLSIKNRSKASFYLAESTTLQARALSIFNSSTLEVNKDNLIPAFLFSGAVGMHFLCETFSAPISNLNTFLDRLVQSLRLLRGVRAMIGDSWEFLKNSDIKCILEANEGPIVDRNDQVIHAFEDLRNNFSHSHTLSAFESKIYCEAVTSLIDVYNSQPGDSTTNGPVCSRIFTTWPIIISAEFTELLNKRKHGALVVMAYFSMLLHSLRSFWAVGDAGRFLLTAIDEYMGEEGVEWLAVPKSIVLPL